MRSTELRPRSMLICTGKKQRTAAIAIFENGFSRPNQLFMIGAKAMIGTAFAATANGMNAVPSGRKAAKTSETATARLEPIAKPPSASLKV